MKKQIIETIKAQILTSESPYQVFGLRAHHDVNLKNVEVEAGDELDNSYDWVDDEPTENELDGVCTIGIPYDEYSPEELDSDIEKALNLVSSYTGTLVLISGSFEGYGQDVGEWIIGNAIVEAKL